MLGQRFTPARDVSYSLSVENTGFADYSNSITI